MMSIVIVVADNAPYLSSIIPLVSVAITININIVNDMADIHIHAMHSITVYGAVCKGVIAIGGGIGWISRAQTKAVNAHRISSRH